MQTLIDLVEGRFDFCGAILMFFIGTDLSSVPIELRTRNCDETVRSGEAVFDTDERTSSRNRAQPVLEQSLKQVGLAISRVARS